VTVDETIYKMIEASIDDGDVLSSSFDVFDSCNGARSILTVSCNFHV
jgi:hypothetical protein